MNIKHSHYYYCCCYNILHSPDLETQTGITITENLTLSVRRSVGRPGCVPEQARHILDLVVMRTAARFRGGIRPHRLPITGPHRPRYL